jgi:hypothetical protein
MMNNMTLYHGSISIIEKPAFGEGNIHNDYGLGFYCTESMELAKEWACGDKRGGFVNTYKFNTAHLSMLDLSGDSYTILNWLAVLINNRTFFFSNSVAQEGHAYLSAHFLPSLSPYDAIKGYRADDSYFAFSLDFLNNTISLRQLKAAMYLGNLGIQIMVKSKKAFNALQFAGYEAVNGEEYFPKRTERDAKARESYLNGGRYGLRLESDIFMIDILRQEIKNEDLRIQRDVS